MENSTDKFAHQIETKKMSSHFFKFLLIGFYVNYISLFSLLEFGVPRSCCQANGEQNSTNGIIINFSK